MGVATCLLLLLSCSIAGQATPSRSSFATGWQDDHLGEKAAGKAWLYIDESRTTPAMRGTDELEEVVVKRTSSNSSSHRPRSPPLQRTGLQAVPPDHNTSGAPSATHAYGSGSHSRLSDLSTAIPSHVPQERPSAPHPEAGSSSKRPHKAKRQPRGTLRYDPATQALVLQESTAGTSTRNMPGEQTQRPTSRRRKRVFRTPEEILARRRESTRQWRKNVPPGRKDEIRASQSEQVRRSRQRQDARLRGNNSPGPPLRKVGRKPRNLNKEEAGADDNRQHAPADTRMVEATQRADDVPHTPRAPRHAATPPAKTIEEENLRLTLAPPGDEDRLDLTLGPPRHD